MTDHLPSKEWLDHAIRQAKIYREVRFQSPAQMQLCAAVDEIERLRTCLTGISTCSTCEACRGAALRALGERTVEEINAAVDERLDRVERELAQPASRLCERCDSAIKNHECGCAKCGCTQCRLAQPPGDGQ